MSILTKVNVILGSTRKISIGKRLFKYLENSIAPLIAEREEIEFKFIQLTDYQLPFFYEDVPPINNAHRTLKSNEQQWIDDMQQADGYLFVTPEYNHSIPAVLKNAIDFLGLEGAKKPAKIISYSDNLRAGQFGGEALKPVLNRLDIITLPVVTTIGNVTYNLDVNGFLIENAPSAEYYQKKLIDTLHEIGFYSKLLKENPFKSFND